MFCSKCGKKVSFFYEELGLDANKKMMYKKFEKCKNCNTVKEVPLDYGVKQYQPRESKKDSVLSLLACIFAGISFIAVEFFGASGLLALLFILFDITGAILGIIDLAIYNKKYRHVGSIVALVFVAIHFVFMLI